MHQWRVTKYDPALRAENGAYIGDDWIIWQEIGDTFNGRKLTVQEYLRVESLYAEAVVEFLKESGLEKLAVRDLWLPPKDQVPEIEKYNLVEPVSLHEGQLLGPDEIRRVVRLQFRDFVSFRLEVPGKFFVHFGFDFYMYVGCYKALPHARTKVTSLGLFVEDFESPHLSFEEEEEVYERYLQDLCQLYAPKILAIRNYEPNDSKDEFGVNDFIDKKALMDILQEVTTGEGDLTPAGKAFLEDYYSMEEVARLMFEESTSWQISNKSKRHGKLAVYKRWLDEVEPMETAMFIGGAQSNMDNDPVWRDELMPPQRNQDIHE